MIIRLVTSDLIVGSIQLLIMLGVAYWILQATGLKNVKGAFSKIFLLSFVTLILLSEIIYEITYVFLEFINSITYFLIRPFINIMGLKITEIIIKQNLPLSNRLVSLPGLVITDSTDYVNSGILSYACLSFIFVVWIFSLFILVLFLDLKNNKNSFDNIKLNKIIIKYGLMLFVILIIKSIAYSVIRYFVILLVMSSFYKYDLFGLGLTSFTNIRFDIAHNLFGNVILFIFNILFDAMVLKVILNKIKIKTNI